MATTKTAAKKTTTTKSTTAKKAETTSPVADIMSFSNGAEWTAKAKEQFESMMESFGENLEEARAKNEELAEELQARFKSSQERVNETNAFLMEAAQEEVSETVQFASDLTNAKSFADALTIQQSYWKKLFENRIERARELTETTVETARETMTPVEVPFANFKSFEKFFAFPVKA
ncbi:phasin family protein [Hyphococcus sp. DH-69]|uniref:phasin family protein n=1 Tax=Hyphococcus formosus TaxID=3143534 RepID=UPI00398AA22A